MKLRTKSRLKLNTRLLPSSIGVLLILLFISPYRGWVVFLAGLGGAWLISFVWISLLARSLTFTRETRSGWTQVGDHLEERFSLINSGYIPAPWIEIVDHSTIPGHPPGWTAAVEAHRQRRWSRWVTSTRRGLFTLGPTTLLTGDPFGVYTLSLEYPTSTPFLVLPPVLSLPSIRVAPGGMSGTGHPRPNAPERTISASSVREYVPGDSQRWIHWRTTARRDALYVRLFDGTPAGDWWIVLDMDQNVQAGVGDDATEEHAIVLAASLADRGLQLKRAVGLVMQGHEMVWRPPQKGDIQRWEILRDLALANPGSRPLSELLTKIKPALSQHASLIVITSSTDNAWIESLLPLIQIGAVPTVILLDPVSFGGSADASETIDLLANIGVTHYTITPDVLNNAQTKHTLQQPWGWEILDSGRVVPTNTTPQPGTRRVLP
jgi:uncharacterized protein (DUF58 family)